MNQQDSCKECGATEWVFIHDLVDSEDCEGCDLKVCAECGADVDEVQ